MAALLPVRTRALRMTLETPCHCHFGAVYKQIQVGQGGPRAGGRAGWGVSETWIRTLYNSLTRTGLNLIQVCSTRMFDSPCRPGGRRSQPESDSDPATHAASPREGPGPIFGTGVAARGSRGSTSDSLNISGRSGFSGAAQEARYPGQRALARSEIS